MSTYQDLWDARKTTEDIDSTFAVTYEMMGEKGIDDPEQELTEEDRSAVAEHLKSVIPELQSFLDELTGQTSLTRRDDVLNECDAIERDYQDQKDDVAVGARAAILRVRSRIENSTESEEMGPEDFTLTPEGVELMNAVRGREERAKQEDEPDDCVRIVLNIPAADLCATQREKLEQDVVRAAAKFVKKWMERVQEVEKRITDETPEPDTSSAEEQVDLPPDEVVADMVQKWSETYESMRPDYNENFDELNVAVFECLIEDGYIQPGPHYNVRTEVFEQMNGKKTSFVTGPKGSRMVNNKEDK